MLLWHLYTGIWRASLLHISSAGARGVGTGTQNHGLVLQDAKTVVPDIDNTQYLETNRRIIHLQLVHQSPSQPYQPHTT
jgi:hypothetical protein